MAHFCESIYSAILKEMYNQRKWKNNNARNVGTPGNCKILELLYKIDDSDNDIELFSQGEGVSRHQAVSGNDFLLFFSLSLTWGLLSRFSINNKRDETTASASCCVSA